MPALTATPAPALAADDRGILSLEIAGPDGEVHSYAIAPAPEGLDRWAVELTRLDGQGDSPYRIALDPRGRWNCDCTNARYRKRNTGPCKHVVAVRGLYLLMRDLGGCP